VFGYAGGRNTVTREVPAVGLVDVNYIIAADAYVRDETRAAPHDLYTTTAALWKAARSRDGAPDPLFTYAADWEGAAKKIRSAHLPFSGVSDVYWQWNGGKGAWLRSHGDVPHVLEGNERVSAASAESSALARLLVVVENYPQLKSNENFLRLMDELAGTESRIATERMRYNEAARDFNTMRRRFPGNLMAGVFGFEERPYFEVPSEAKVAPKVDFGKK
jgi:hypothetical protein